MSGCWGSSWLQDTAKKLCNVAYTVKTETLSYQHENNHCVDPNPSHVKPATSPPHPLPTQPYPHIRCAPIKKIIQKHHQPLLPHNPPPTLPPQQWQNLTITHPLSRQNGTRANITIQHARHNHVPDVRRRGLALKQREGVAPWRIGGHGVQFVDHAVPR